ncbi:MAG: SET domain-containing protein [Candidatus Aenigmarchaeota archaeon]|nr:SET domain-containing protein [Candidatus Aenigmarchaeota archaeon]
MSAKDVIVKSAGRKGKGVFAARDFKKGEVVLIYKKSKILNKHEIPKRWTGKYKYLDVVGQDKFMIMKPPERYINCSCDPNVYVKNWKFVAMHPIKKGGEFL